MIYLITFIASFISLNIWEKYDIKKIADKKNLFLVFGIGIAILLATLRDVSIGTDVRVYVVPCFERANASKTFISFLKKTNIDMLYAVLNYIVSRFSDNIAYLFLVIETIDIAIIYAGLYNLKEIISPSYAMLIYYFLFYNKTLSTVRQFIALSIFVFAISIFIKNKANKNDFIKVLFLICLSVGFHSTALVCFAIFILCYIILTKKININVITLCTVFSAIILCLFADPIRYIIEKISNILFSKYSNDAYYAIGDGVSGHSLFLILDIVIVLSLYMIKRSDKNNIPAGKINSFLLILNILYFIFLIGLSRYNFLVRTLYYIQIFWPIAYAQIGNKLGKDKFSKTFINLIILTFICFFWWYYYINADICETYPYIFMK